MRTDWSALGKLFFGQTRGGILRLLFDKPTERFYVRQIARHVGASAGSVQRELETLSRVGLVDRARIGVQVFYGANRSHPAFLEVQSLVAKTVGTYGILRTALAPLAGRISQAFVFGSFARREETASSDVDLMIVGNVTLDEVLGVLGPVEESIQRPVNPTLYSAKEFDLKRRSGHHFLRSVLRGDRVILIGDQDEPGKVGGIRLAQGRALQP